MQSVFFGIKFHRKFTYSLTVEKLFDKITLKYILHKREVVEMAVASLVLGIISVIIGLFSAGSLGWLGAILAIIGIILGAVAKKNAQGGMATAGLVLSIIGLVLCLILYIACVACIGGLASAF